MATRNRYHCCYCGYDFPAALPVTQEPNGAMLLNHLAAMHRDELRPYLARMATEDIAAVAAEAYEVVEGDARPDGP
jgi:hypothetical protein